MKKIRIAKQSRLISCGGLAPTQLSGLRLGQKIILYLLIILSTSISYSQIYRAPKSNDINDDMYSGTWVNLYSPELVGQTMISAAGNGFRIVCTGQPPTFLTDIFGTTTAQAEGRILNTVRYKLPGCNEYDYNIIGAIGNNLDMTSGKNIFMYFSKGFGVTYSSVVYNTLSQSTFESLQILIPEIALQNTWLSIGTQNIDIIFDGTHINFLDVVNIGEVGSKLNIVYEDGEEDVSEVSEIDGMIVNLTTPLKKRGRHNVRIYRKNNTVIEEEENNTVEEELNEED